jgi:hypothetical protein
MVLAPAAAPVRTRGFVHPVDDPNGTHDWTAERLTLESPVRENDWVRFSFESARSGYLYVINRDVFADGRQGAAMLIFPTRHIHEGENRIEPGQLVQIPDPKDEPPAFRAELAKPNQTGILLIVIVTLQPIPDIAVKEDKQKVSEDSLRRWEAEWASDVEVSSDSSISGVFETVKESKAALDPTLKLGSGDRIPVILYHRRGHAGEPIFAKAMIKLDRR